ncbi:aminotransferase class I/II-fold pyridoxal phosphate-dependent enzyme [Shimia haliotis]|uniref:7-keto-8-aminopelargonate synthetase n=1 Tax=Shimia haliotis TaxID=1280847 RepID=A0A1I4E8V8_9RHOB|nr:aminotransferase class I/II-fold pyridoxal phosphate-dependent enzyme [Shimia haliotis]SFL02185.1 7-keto-8-aminopelargonate synthetase [Shimia haliotis]
MTQKDDSFLSYADRRFRLSGKAIIENGHPYFVPTDALEARSAEWKDGYLSMSHYDYLGLGHHPATTSAAKTAIDIHGTGAGASRLVGGERLAHKAFERAMADFLGVGGTLSVISGYLTNVSVIQLLLGPKDLVIVDELAHNSIMVGAKGVKSDLLTYAHNDLDDLERIIASKRDDYSRVLICTEGLFSMDGDITNLPRLLDIKERADCWLLLDEAHSYGVLGPTGRGTCEHFGVDPNRVEVAIGTLSKSFGSSGGFIAANADVIEWMRFCLPGFVYSVGLSPSTVASAHAALDILKAEPDRVTRLRGNSRRFLHRARDAGLNTGTAIGEAVVPILFETPEDCIFVAEALMQQGIYAPPVVHIGVPKDLPRIRFFISETHSEADIDRVIAAVAEASAAAQAMRNRISAE